MINYISKLIHFTKEVFSKQTPSQNSTLNPKTTSLDSISRQTFSQISSEQPKTQAGIKDQWKITQKPFFIGMGADVGIMREKWTHPSDHLPIGVTLQGQSPIHIATWNILADIYMKHVMDDYQGLMGSAITTEHEKVTEEGITLRNQHLIDHILQMLTDKDRPRGVIALQECGKTFIQHLKKSLAPHFKLSLAGESEEDQIAMIYNSNIFDLVEKNGQQGVFSDKPSRGILNLLLKQKDTGELIRCITVHLPWVLQGPATQELSAYILEQKRVQKEGETMVVMGDMNRTEVEIFESLKELGDFQQISPYPTMIPYLKDGIYTQSADFDHIFVFGERRALANAPNEVLERLNILVERLLHKPT